MLYFVFLIWLLSSYRTSSSLWMRKKCLECSWPTGRSTMSFSSNSWTFWRVRPSSSCEVVRLCRPHVGSILIKSSARSNAFYNA